MVTIHYLSSDIGGPDADDLDDTVTLALTLKIISTIAGLIAAAFWLWSALVPVPDNIDTFMDALQRAARLSSYAAVAAVVAALAAIPLLWIE